MNNPEIKKNKKSISKEHRILAKNSFYSYLQSYSAYFFSIITSFFIARLISQKLWGFFILALSYISIFSIFLEFFPPSLGLSLNYYIPRYRELNQPAKLKSLIYKSVVIRISFVLMGYFLSVLIFTLFLDLFRINLLEYTHLFYILSPLIIIRSLNVVFNEINRSLNRFKTVYILLVINNSIYISGLIFSFLFISGFDIEILSFLLLFSNLIPFLINIITIIIVYKFKLRSTNELGLSYKEVFKDLYKYGYQLSLRNVIISFSNNLRTIFIGIFESKEMVTGYNIGKHYDDVSRTGVGSLSSPIGITFSGLYAKNKMDQIAKIYRVTLHYTVFLVLLLSGLLYFLVDLFLFVVYGESYLTYSLLVKLMLFSTIFNVFGAFYSLLRVSNKLKYITPLSLLSNFLRISFLLIGLIFFGIIGGISGLLIANILNLVIQIIMSHKLFNIKMGLFKAGLQYIIFFISLGITLFLEFLILAQLNYIILHTLNLLIFENFQFLSFLVFITLFLLLNIVFRVFSVTDIEYIEGLFKKDNFFHKTIRKGLKYLKKMVRN